MRPNDGKHIAKGKGVHREVESEEYAGVQTVIGISHESLAKFKAKLKLLTMRSNGMGYERRKELLHNVIRGWVSYFKYAYAKTYLQSIDEWLRKRMNLC